MILLHYEGFSYYETSNENGNFIVIVNYAFKSGDITIPSHIEGIPVCEIGSRAFVSSGARRIILPEGIERIGPGAFKNCKNLESITLPNTLIRIDSDAFEFSGIKNVFFGNNLKSIGDCAFSYCDELNNVVLPDSLEHVGSGCFDCCGSLESLHIGENVASFDSYPNILQECYSLKQLTVSPKNLHYSATDNMLMTHDGCLLRCAPFTPKHLLEIPKHIQKVAEGAFDDLENPHIIKISNDELLLENSGLENIWDLTLKCNPTSKAAKWGERNGVEVRLLQSRLEDFLSLNDTNVNANSVSPVNENDEMELQ